MIQMTYCKSKYALIYNKSIWGGGKISGPPTIVVPLIDILSFARIIEDPSTTSMNVKADIHHHKHSFDDVGNENNAGVELLKFTTPLHTRNQEARPSMGFGLQASGPLSTKSAMANIRFQGRQFAITTNEKVNLDLLVVLG